MEHIKTKLGNARESFSGLFCPLLPDSLKSKIRVYKSEIFHVRIGATTSTDSASELQLMSASGSKIKATGPTARQKQVGQLEWRVPIKVYPLPHI